MLENPISKILTKYLAHTCASTPGRILSAITSGRQTPQLSIQKDEVTTIELLGYPSPKECLQDKQYVCWNGEQSRGERVES